MLALAGSPPDHCYLPGVVVIKCPECSFDNLDGSAYCDSCGDALGAAPAPAPPSAPASAGGGRVIAGRYRIEREIGGGGQKLMYLAADLRLNDRLCALAELTASARTQEAMAEGKEMFRREAEILATLSNIHVVQVYDYFDENNRCYLVEEYVRGQSLQAKIAGRGALSVGEITGIALQVLDALEYLHSLTPPLVHRDLKPDNIMLAPVTGGAEIVKLIVFRNRPPFSGPARNRTRDAGLRGAGAVSRIVRAAHRFICLGRHPPLRAIRPRPPGAAPVQLSAPRHAAPRPAAGAVRAGGPGP